MSNRLLASSAVMAAGTVVSRLSGFVRAALLASALGIGLHADVFQIANTIPNMLYILLAGGVFNAVLVPQLVRAMKHDEDAGEAYVNRLVTLATLFLAAVSVLLVLAAPLIVPLLLNGAYDSPSLAAERASAIALARYCLPQVFFYGMFVLVGQILNARGRFGPMMWAPIANNVISVAVLVGYIWVYGATGKQATCGGYSTGQEAWLGLGSTVGIVVQLVILVPYLRAAGLRFRPRFDFRHAGLSHTLRLGWWTVLFVVVNQIAYTVVVKLASGGTALEGCSTATKDTGTGYTVYSNAYLITQVPHSVITVSLATAALPALSALAADRQWGGLARMLGSTLRSALVIVVPFAILLVLGAADISKLIFGHGAAASSYTLNAPTIAWFAPGLVLFTVHYLYLRGFYALEDTRTAFYNQCFVAATNVVVGYLLVRASDPDQTAPALAIAYGCSYAVGATLATWRLRDRLHQLDGHRTVRFVVRWTIACVVASVPTWLLGRWLHTTWDHPNDLQALITLTALSAVIGAALLVVSRAMRITEVTEVVDLVRRRLPGPGR